MQRKYFQPIAYIIVFLLGAIHLSSCKKDLGNYAYNEINEAEIVDLDTLYTINSDEHFKANPKINFTKDKNPDTANYRYEWYKGIDVGYGGMAPELLSSKLSIDTLLDMGLGKYEMYFRVTDKKSGVYFQKNFRLAIINKAYEGWLLLSDINGGSRVDMVSIYNKVFKSYKNILDTMKSDLIPSGKPVAIGTCRTNASGSGSFVNYVVTNTDGKVFGFNDMKNVPNEALSVLIPESTGFDYSNTNMTFAPLLDCISVNNNIYLRNSFRYKDLINKTESGVKFQASSYFASSVEYYEPIIILFNEDTKALYRYPGTGTASFPLTITELAGKTDDLAYMTYSMYNGGEVFAIFKDKLNRKMFLARFGLNGKLSYYNEITGTDIYQAEQFAISPAFGYIFYTVGNKVYEYDTSLKSSISMLELQGEKISMIKFHRFLLRSLPQLSVNVPGYLDLEKQLIVASYKEDQPATTGKLSLYEVPPINGKLILKNSFEGFGKIVDVTYKER
jgi:hypothetical protein